MKLSQIRLLTLHFKETFAFYQGLGLEVSWGSSDEVYASFSTGLSEIALFDKAAMFETLAEPLPPATNSASVLIVLEVPELDAFYAQNKARLHFLAAPVTRADWGVRTSHLYDPEGNLVEINQTLR